MLKMDPLTESLTVNNIDTNKHVNLVQVKKIKVENSSTISLDIISGKCENGKWCQQEDFQLKIIINCLILTSIRYFGNFCTIQKW